jgi:hypothetical protein
MNRKTLEKKELVVLMLEDTMGLYLQENAPAFAEGFVRRVLCCSCFKRVAWTDVGNRYVKYVKTHVPCKACRSTKKEEK